MSADQTFNDGSHDAFARDIKDDNAAFERFFKEQFGPLCAWCRYKFGFDTDTAKETVHTAFIKLWKTRASLDPGLPVNAYLHKIIVNTALDILKQAKNREKLAQYLLHNNTGDNLTEPSGHFDIKKLGDDIDTAIAELPEQMRAIFELSRYQGLKYAEIAHQLDISVNTVETQMVRALKKLRVKLAGWLSLFFILLGINRIL